MVIYNMLIFYAKLTIFTNFNTKSKLHLHQRAKIRDLRASKPHLKIEFGINGNIIKYKILFFTTATNKYSPKLNIASRQNLC